MNKGVPQGGSMGQSTYIRRAAQLHPLVSILLIADDTHVLGTQEEVIDLYDYCNNDYSGSL